MFDNRRNEVFFREGEAGPDDLLNCANNSRNRERPLYQICCLRRHCMIEKTVCSRFANCTSTLTNKYFRLYPQSGSGYPELVKVCYVAQRISEVGTPPGAKSSKQNDIFKVDFYVTPPCFLESVFCQELEKTGFRITRGRESDEKHLFPYRTHHPKSVFRIS